MNILSFCSTKQISSPFFALVWLVGGLSAPLTAQQPPAEVRVGVIAFQDFDRDFGLWQSRLARLTARVTPPVRFRLAVGGYSDVLHWIRGGQIDAAVLTPGAFTQLQFADHADHAFTYMASIGLPPAVSAWASDDRKTAGAHFRYRSVCVVPRDSSIHHEDDVLALTKKGQTQFLFVHPFSASGRIAPQYVLHEMGVECPPQRIEYGYSHTGVLRLLAKTYEPSSPVVPIGFVWDDALREGVDLQDRLRRLPLKQLDTLAIPHDVIVARRAAPFFGPVQQSLAEFVDEQGNKPFRVLDD